MTVENTRRGLFGRAPAQWGLAPGAEPYRMPKSAKPIEQRAYDIAQVFVNTLETQSPDRVAQNNAEMAKVTSPFVDQFDAFGFYSGRGPANKANEQFVQLSHSLQTAVKRVEVSDKGSRVTIWFHSDWRLKGPFHPKIGLDGMTTLTIEPDIADPDNVAKRKVTAQMDSFSPTSGKRTWKFLLLADAMRDLVTGKQEPKPSPYRPPPDSIG